MGKVALCVFLFFYSVNLLAGPENSYDCLVEPWKRVEISFDDTGLIEHIGVARSQRVEKGQELARLESGVEQATVELRKSKAAMNEAVSLASANLQFARRNLARIEGLYNKKAVPFSVFDEAKTEVLVSEQQLKTAENNKHLATLDLAIARQGLQRRTVVSPIDGVVVKLIRSEGEYVKDEPIMLLEQLSLLRVKVLLPVSEFSKISVGEAAAVSLQEPMNGVERDAKVVMVDRGIDVASGTFGVHLELVNDDFSIPSGLKCHVKFQGS
ncbi:RND family efflux transporter MFP subunit [Sinobacterium caligoides]|uniref:RND family efflux transporter MFP subunit n=1 Tax=Sinobacterium caligoides TaxID=933926 RepID=A0A3N2DYA1_9GAMM|nr:efflux RND transporter periplasmic adaptor subunit [Sinobacterium caligoides]ROS04830.1 RND family efflux transporter MFP subunit [Sinobacterium caligoides]